MPASAQGKRRTTNDSAEQPVKRTRVSRACDQCRTAREKCDGVQPSCSTCLVSKRRCAYTANPKKRGIQPGYIRSLELALVWLFQQNPDNEATLNEKLSQGGASSLFLSRDSKEATKLHKRWRKTRFYTHVDKLLSGGEPSRHEQTEPLSASTDDDDSEQEQSSKATRNAQHHSSQQQTSTQGCRTLQHLYPHHRTADSDPIVMPSDSWALFDTYFTYTQSWLPICEKHDMLKLSYSYPTEGLSLVTGQEGTGSHAELWSILAVASLHNNSVTSSPSPSRQSPKDPLQLYDIARSLVPTEQSQFDLGHVKALLNLALFKIALSHPQSAWLLVGHASRVLEGVESSELLASPRRKHVFAGCFLLDNLLATQLERRPYFRRRDLDFVGVIDEDGLEEWQPWHGLASSSEQMRTPMLALSTFNSLLELVDILANAETRPVSSGSKRDMSDQIKSWESCLPPKLSYVHSEIAVSGLCPPSALLQLTYYCTSFMTSPSIRGLERVLHVLEHYKSILGFKSLPPVMQCLLNIIGKSIVHLVGSDSILTHFRKLQTDMASTWSIHIYTKNTPGNDHANPQWPGTTASVQYTVPAPPLMMLPIIQPVYSTGASHNVPSGYNTVYPDAPAPLDPQLAAPSPANSDPRYPELNSDLENFFDDLASLDNTTRMDTQPQFMQNLGFAPDASMADLLGEYIPTQSTAFMPRHDVPGADFQQYSFYNAG